MLTDDRRELEKTLRDSPHSVSGDPASSRDLPIRIKLACLLIRIDRIGSEVVCVLRVSVPCVPASPGVFEPIRSRARERRPCQDAVMQIRVDQGAPRLGAGEEAEG